MNLPALCSDVFPTFLIFSPNVSSIVYYAHIPAIVISLFFIFFILKNGKGKLSNYLLASVLFFSALWILFSLIFWASNRSDVIMFVWAMDILIEPLVYIGSFYFIYQFLEKKDLSFALKLLIGLIYLPVIILTPTHFNLSGFDLASCLSIEGFLGYYDYIIEGLFVAWLLILFLKKYHSAVDALFKKQILYVTIGVFLFLFAFSWGNLVSSITDNWQISLVGFLALPVFVGFLVYSIVRFQTFNIKLIASQALVVGLAVLTASEFLFIKSTTSYALTAVTLLLVVIFGDFLIKSVKREVMQREQLQILSDQLFDANEKLKGLDKLKTEFLSLASHQLRSPLTAIKGYTSMILEGDFGEINPKAKDATERVFQSTINLTKIVEDLLNVSKIEQGGMKYEMAPFSVAEIARDMSKDLSITAKKKNLTLTFGSDKDEDCIANGDKEKIRQVVLNFIDNSIKYTKEEGTIEVSVRRAYDKVRFAVKDNGMGMTPEIKATLFQKFSRGDGARMNTSGSGLGLYLAKEIIEAHKGTVGVDSEGPGKGSTFYFELDAI